MNTVFIYSLSHPITGEIRYIGKTVKKLEKRLNGHIFESKTPSCHRHNWINSLLKEGVRPEIKLIDIVSKDDWQFWEMHWIEQFKVWGFNLTNGTIGGDGCDWTGKKHTKETKEKIRKAKTGVPSWNKGIAHSNEHKNNLSKAHAGKKLSKESIEKRSQTNRKPVAIIDSNGNILETFSGTVEARNKTGVDCSQIKKLIETGTQSKKKGYIFKYI